MSFKICKIKDLNVIRSQLYDLQEGKCCICKSKIELKDSRVDHQHCLKSDTLGEDNNGLIRGLLCDTCNRLEGKIWNNCKRFKNCNSNLERIEILESIINYYKDNFTNVEKILHPKEIRPLILKKSVYNKFLKDYNESKNFKKLKDYLKDKDNQEYYKLIFKIKKFPAYKEKLKSGILFNLLKIYK